MKTVWKEKLRLQRLDMVRRTMRSERGISLVVVIMLMVIILAITGAGLLFSSIDLKVSGNYRVGTQAFYAADMGASVGFAQIGMVPATSIVAIPKTSPSSELFYCSGMITGPNSSNNCTTPQPLVNLGTAPATGCSLGRGQQLNAGTCYVRKYQIDVTGGGPLGATRQVQSLVTFGPLN